MTTTGSKDIDAEGEAIGTVKREVDRDESAAGHDDSTRASQFDRQLLRCRCLAVMNLINDEREDLTRAELDKFSSIIQEVEMLRELVQKPREQVAAAEVHLGIDKTLASSAKSHSDEGITAAEFVNRLLNEYGHSPGEVAHQDNGEIVVRWIDIGLAVAPIFSKAYGCSTMIGPMNTELKQQQRTEVPRRRAKPAETACPEKIPMAGSNPSRATSLSSSVLQFSRPSSKGFQFSLLTRSIVVERLVSLADFNCLQFEGQTIQALFTHQGWVPQLSWTGKALPTLVRDFYAALVDVDTKADVWELNVRGVAVRFSADKLAAFLGIMRHEASFPMVELETKTPVAEVFCTLIGRHQAILSTTIDESKMTPFWRIMHQIIAYNIDPRPDTIECTIERARLMLLVARRVRVDLPLYIFRSIRWVVQGMLYSDLPCGLLLTRFLQQVGVPVLCDYPIRQLGPIGMDTCPGIVGSNIPCHAASAQETQQTQSTQPTTSLMQQSQRPADLTRSSVEAQLKRMEKSLQEVRETQAQIVEDVRQIRESVKGIARAPT